MSTPFDDAADAEWLADRREHLLKVVRQQRPPRLTVSGDMHPEVAQWSERLVDGTAGNLLLGGPTGVGKTWHAWEALERAVISGFAGRWDFADSAEWQDTIAPPNVDRERLEAMREVDLLVFDDLGSSRINEWQRECLLSVVDKRWAHSRPVVITFNVESLKDMLGERISSRLADNATRVALEGDDKRRQS